MNREELLAFRDLEVVPVVIPEWKGITLHVRTLTEGERQALSHEIFVEGKGDGKGALANSVSLSVKRMAYMRARLVEMATCNSDGTRYFKDGDTSQLMGKSSKAIERLHAAAEKLNALTAAAPEDMEKNSETVVRGVA